MTDKSNLDKSNNGKGSNPHDPFKINKRSFIISILVVSVIVGSLITASLLSSKLFTISSTQAQQTPSSVPSSQPQQPSSSSSPGNSGSNPHGGPPGKTGNNPGQSGNTPGQSGSPPPGQSGNTPGQCNPPMLLCDGKCVNPQTDMNNCGTCGNSCDPVNEKCQDGLCVNRCGLGQTVCDSICIDTSKDPSNCGACNNECSENEFCDGGTCKSQCGPGEASCINDPIVICRNLQIDNQNCGACGHDCSSAFAVGSTCVTGRCECPQGEEVFNGQCVPKCPADMVRNPTGVCECRDPTKVNVNGQCQCVPGRTDCHTAESSCKDLSSDADYCGACNIRCASGATCINGACQCPSGQTACGNPAVCVDPKTDNRNCGICGKSCAPGETCSNGQCTGKVKCQPNFACQSGVPGDNKALCYPADISKFCFAGCPLPNPQSICGDVPLVCCEPQTNGFAGYFPGCQVPGQYEIPNEC